MAANRTTNWSTVVATNRDSNDTTEWPTQLPTNKCSDSPTDCPTKWITFVATYKATFLAAK